MKRIHLSVLCMALFWLLAACGAEQKEPQKLKDLEFTVVADENLPLELKEILEKEQGAPFKITYEDDGWLYVAEGYGPQKSGGYSIQVNAFYETQNAVYVDMNLLGPGDADIQGTGESFPYIVLKTEQIGKNVVFG